MKVRGDRFTVVEEYKTPYPHSILFQQGEEVVIQREFTADPDWKNWVWCEGKNHNSAWVPKQYIHNDGKKGTLLRDFDAKELSVLPGEVLVVHEVVNGFGMSYRTNGDRGWVPIKVMAKK